GKLGDGLGRKWFYVSGIVFFVIGSALGGFAQTMTMLIIGRAVPTTPPTPKFRRSSKSSRAP
ncbi:MFS transporter, partial [Corynebacterium sp. P4_F2]|uniref:MFS transporter n=1 Tax=Corynebacterium sp. P4_F2 TaxID=3059677 RepID=UPI0026525AE1